jgi:hypothetical protein
MHLQETKQQTLLLCGAWMEVGRKNTALLQSIFLYRPAEALIEMENRDIKQTQVSLPCCHNMPRAAWCSSGALWQGER